MTDATDRSMRAVVIEAPRQEPEVRVVPRPEVLPGEVLVRSYAFSICGSDVELVTGVRGHPFVRYPVIPGHEWSGTVAEVRSTDAGLSVGDEVIVVGIAGCGHCRSCLAATPGLCDAASSGSALVRWRLDGSALRCAVALSGPRRQRRGCKEGSEEDGSFR